MSEYYIQVPPDSTGKAVRHSVQLEIDYTNPINPGAVTFEKGEIVTFGTSGMVGTVGLDHYAGGLQHAEPHVHLLLSHGSVESIVANEDMLVDGVKRAEATTTTTPFYIPVVQLIGGTNPTHTQRIDKRGAATVRFSEGGPRFDSFGRMQVSAATTIGDYGFNYDGRDGHFTDTEIGGGTVTHDSTVGCMVLSNGTASGDISRRRTDVHHKYIPGQSQLMAMTVATGDLIKTNLIRRWGLFSDDDGVYFRHHGDDGDIDLVIRSSTSGSVVETLIHQDAWNTDRLNGAGGSFNLSNATLDVSKDNIYWIDYQWLGAGAVRFGVEIAGERITCHVWDNSNNQNVSYMRTGSLPLTIEQENIGVTGSTSELRWFCGTVKSEGPFAPHMGQFNIDSVVTKVVAGGSPLTGSVPLLSVRPLLNFNGRTNKIVILPLQFSGLCLNAAGTGDGYMLVEMWKNATLIGSVWGTSVSIKSGAEIDTSATSLSGGRRVSAMYVKGTAMELIGEMFNYLHENLVNKQDGTLQHYTIAVTPMTDEDINVAGSFTWNEIRD